MPEAYTEAAARHWTDSDLLKRTGRTANADHLVGLAAECALKSAMILLPAFLDTNGRLRSNHYQHINELWERLPFHHIQGRFPGLAAILRVSNPFSDFSIEQRYSADSA